MKSEQWKSILYRILELDSFKQSIKNEGYYLSPEYSSFGQYLRQEWNINSETNAANFLSIDFWSEQNKVLTNSGYYLIRTGQGSFAIFDEKQFPRPYLNLETTDSEAIVPQEPEGFLFLKKAFKQNILEEAALEQLRFNGVFHHIVNSIHDISNKKYFTGPRGSTKPTFQMYFQRTDGEVVFIKKFTGQADIDYSIWTDDAVLVFEAKKSYNQGLDVGWHKLAFACAKLIDGFSAMKIFPVYFLRHQDRVMLFVFPQFRFHNGDGIILNDQQAMKPFKTYSIQIEESLPEYF